MTHRGIPKSLHSRLMKVTTQHRTRTLSDLSLFARYYENDNIYLIRERESSQRKLKKIYYLTSSYTIQEAELRYDQADLLLTKIRDEAHRFANKYRTTRMSKEWK